MTGPERPGGLDFAPWLEHVFGHEVRHHQAQWYFDLDAPIWDGPAALTAAHLIRMFENPEPALADFAASQIVQGLYYLIDPGAGGLTLDVAKPEVSHDQRRRFVRSIGTLFADFLARRCTPHLSHLDETGAGALNGVCYMWWDVMPWVHVQGDRRAQAELDRDILQVMDMTLGLDSIACQESALHGLGHAQSQFPEPVAAIIERFLAASAERRPELIGYARAALCGCVQ